MLQVVAELKVEHLRVAKLSRTILAFAGLGYLSYSIYRIGSDFDGFVTGETIRDFITPILLSLLFLPFMYVFMLYITYETNFGRINWLLKDKRLRRKAKWRAMSAFRLDIELLTRWTQECVRSRPSNEEEIVKTIQDLKSWKRMEKHAPPIDPAVGWSPYTVKDILANNGLATGDYHPVDSEDWFASSRMLELEGDIIPNNLAYYVDGNQETAKRLKLMLNVNDPKSARNSKERLASEAEKLLRDLFPGCNFDTMVKTIRRGGALDDRIEGCRVRFWRQNFQAPRRGYSLHFEIVHRSVAEL